MRDRRGLIKALAAGGAALPAIRMARAQDRAGYPNRPIRLVVGFPAGQTSDVGARVVARQLSEALGQPVVVDNKPGASGIVSHEAVKAAAPDGYTLLMGSTGTLAINPTLFRTLPYEPVRDFAPVALIASSPQLLATGANGPAKTLAEMIAHARARPGQVSYGSSGIGTTSHIAMEMLKKEAGLDMVHVPYRGAPAMLTDLIAGRVQFCFDAPTSILPQVAEGRVRMLGSGGTARSPRMPDVPTIAEQGYPRFGATAWTGVLAPAGTPPAIVEALSSAINRGLRSEETVQYYATTGSDIRGGTPADFEAFLRQEIAAWGAAVRDSGARVE